ncbi:MAG: type II secretion system protein J [Pseudobdellovibrionaceae bacterium]
MLVEVLVAVAIMAIIAVGMAAMTVSIARQNTSLQEKLQSIELEQSIHRLMADSNNCACMFANLAWPTNGTEISLGQLKNGCQTGGTALISAGQKINPSSNMKVASVKLKNLKNIDATTVSGDLEILFDEGTLESALKPISIPSQSFTLTGSSVRACLGVQGADRICSSLGGTWNGTTCATKPPPPTETCTSIGGTWTDGACRAASSATTADVATGSAPQVCASLGGTWTSGACIPASPSGGSTPGQCYSVTCTTANAGTRTMTFTSATATKILPLATFPGGDFGSGNYVAMGITNGASPWGFVCHSNYWSISSQNGLNATFNESTDNLKTVKTINGKTADLATFLIQNAYFVDRAECKALTGTPRSMSWGTYRVMNSCVASPIPCT